MASNIYTKNEILQALASKGYFIDVYTLNTFFTKWNIEAIFEDEQGGEFFDKNALDLVLNNLFNAKNEEPKNEPQENPNNQAQQLQPPTQSQNTELQQTLPVAQTQEIQTPQINSAFPNDAETNDILSNIALSDGSPLINKVKDDLNLNITPPDINLQDIPDISPMNIENDLIETKKPAAKKKMGILEGAMQTLDETTQQEIQQEQEERQEVVKEIQETEKTIQDFQNQTEQIQPNNNTLNIQTSSPPMPAMPTQESADFDDMSLLSDSVEVQEKFKEYIVNEVAKKQGLQAAPVSNEFKLDISERTISMVARTLAKKIAKHVSNICSADAKTIAQLEEIKQENKKLEQKTKELENQNKKLRLLLAESNKNLNSYKPSVFGLYKKVPPQ